MITARIHLDQIDLDQADLDQMNREKSWAKAMITARIHLDQIDLDQTELDQINQEKGWAKAMITAQDIREKTFTKQFNGYSMSQVDEFLDELAADISAMAKENAALNAKMRVLVEKIEEYRQTEDSMRLALLSAQKMSAQVESEAQEKADAILAEARETAGRLTSHATKGIANEEAKLEEAKKTTARFIDHMHLVLEKQMEFYDKLSRANLVPDAKTAEEKPAPAKPEEEKPAEVKPAEAPAKEEPKPANRSAVDDAVRSIESSVQKAVLEQPEEPIVVDTELPEEEEEPTRRFGMETPKKKHSFDDFRFDDDI